MSCVAINRLNVVVLTLTLIPYVIRTSFTIIFIRADVLLHLPFIIINNY